jgi:hypothetical protein
MGGMSLGPASCSGRSISSVSGYLYCIIALLHYCIIALLHYCIIALYYCIIALYCMNANVVFVHATTSVRRQGKARQGRAGQNHIQIVGHLISRMQ